MTDQIDGSVDLLSLPTALALIVCGLATRVGDIALKRLSFTMKLWLARHAQLSARSRLREKAMRAERHKGTRLVTTYLGQKEIRQRAWVAGRIPMPEVFCLERNYEEAAAALISARRMLRPAIDRLLRAPHLRNVRPHHIRNFLDFTTIKECGPAAALSLASEFHRSRLIVPWIIPLIDIDRWRGNVVGMLDEIGFFDLLEIQHPRKELPESETRVVKFSSGEMVESNAGGKLLEALAQIIKSLDREEELDATLAASRKRLFGALVEATENTRVHAYEGVDDPAAVHRWWMTGAVDRAKKELTIMVYDQGISIPASLPLWKGYPWIHKAFSRMLGQVPPAEDQSYDGTRIRLAMGAPLSSSSGLPYRGKGFPAYKDVVHQCRSGRLRIISRRGEFIYETGKRARAKVLETPLLGTLVEWNLSV